MWDQILHVEGNFYSSKKITISTYDHMIGYLGQRYFTGIELRNFQTIQLKDDFLEREKC